MSDNFSKAKRLSMLVNPANAISLSLMEMEAAKPKPQKRKFANKFLGEFIAR